MVLTRISSTTLNGEQQPAPGKHQAMETLPMDECPQKEPLLGVHCRQAGGWSKITAKPGVGLHRCQEHEH